MINKITMLITASLAVSTFVGCAAISDALARAEKRRIQEYRENYCSYNGAYALGISDGKARGEFRLKASVLCDAQDKGNVEKGYRAGYEIGLKNSPSEVIINDRRRAEAPVTYGNWDCSEDILTRSGSFDTNRCGTSKPWACYQDIKQRCNERRTGETSSRTEKHYTNCSSSLSDCWQ